MIKFLQLFSIAFFPYLIVFVLIFIFKGYNTPSLSIFIGLYFIALINAVIIFIRSIINKTGLVQVLRTNMIIKLIHVPAYLCIFILSLACMVTMATIFTLGDSITLIIIDIMTRMLSGLIGLGGVIRSLRENKISIKKAFIHGIFQFVFCVDIISSIVIYRKVKKQINKEVGEVNINKKKEYIYIISSIIVFTLIHSITYTFDRIQIDNDVDPRFCIEAVRLKDGGTTLYYGFGYQIIKWNSLKRKIIIRGVNVDGVEHGFEIHRFPFFVDWEKGPTVKLEFRQ